VNHATHPTPAGPFTILADDDGAVLASGWTTDAGALAQLIAPGLRTTALKRRHDLGAPTRALRAYLAGELDGIDAVDVRQRSGPLVERGCQALATYFQLWTAHNGRVLRTVPPDRLMLVRTHEINERIPDIAAWVGIPQDNLRRDRSWLFQASRKHRVLATLDPGYVRATADEHCSGLMQQYFPEVSSPN